MKSNRSGAELFVSTVVGFDEDCFSLVFFFFGFSSIGGGGGGAGFSFSSAGDINSL